MSTKYIVNNASGQTITGDVTINGNLNVTGVTNTRPYKVYTALLSQATGTIESLVISGGSLVVGVTYVINNNSGNPDFTNVGAPNNNSGTYFIATGTTPNSWGNENANLIYNTGAPIPIVLENTIGNVWFTYIDIGRFEMNSDGLFPLENTVVLNSTFFSINAGNLVTLSTSGFESNNENSIFLTTVMTVDGILDFYDGVLGPSTIFEVRVYNNYTNPK
jgi:hypothetical protein